MKKILSILCFLIAMSNMIYSQNDTLYIIRNGLVVSQYPVNIIDSITFQRPQNYYSTMIDPRDNHSYRIMAVGNQIWMAENLAYLPSVNGPSVGSRENPFYYVYQYNGTDTTAAKATSYYETYGVLYNFPAALTACPPGWHLPTDAEYTNLATFVGGSSVAGGKLKEVGYDHWLSPNTGATDQIGFTALPGSSRMVGGTFNLAGSYCYLWTSTIYNIDASLGVGIVCNLESFSIGHHFRDYALSIRCIMD